MPQHTDTTEQFVAGWNLPGCLPDTDEPLPTFDSFADAAAYIEDAIRHEADSEFEYAESDEDQDYARELESIANEVRDNMAGPFEIYAGNWCYFVMENTD